MMSSFETSSPVSASTLAYLMRCPVLRLIWLKLIFSESEVAGYRATGQVTSERRKKPFQLARGAIQNTPKRNRTRIQDDPASLVPTINRECSIGGTPFLAACQKEHLVNKCRMQLSAVRSEIEHMRRQ